MEGPREAVSAGCVVKGEALLRDEVSAVMVVNDTSE